MEEVGAFEPVGGGEGLSGEGPVAMEAEEALDAIWFGLTGIEASTFEWPGRGVVEVERAVWVGAEWGGVVSTTEVHGLV